LIIKEHPLKLTIDPVAGMAGDMFIAALINAGAREEAVLAIASRAGSLLGRAEISLDTISPDGKQGARLRTSYTHDRAGVSAVLIEKKLAQICVEFAFSPQEKEFAGRAFDILCEAEAGAHEKLDGHDHHHLPHGGGKEHVHLHEAQDILVDICGAARALTLLAIDPAGVTCLAPVCYGGGTVTFSHGTFPVPAPAVKEIIDRYRLPVSTGPVPRELLTPTGAALLAALRPRYVERNQAGDPYPPDAVPGLGLGTIDFGTVNGVQNGLRVFIHAG
jgi:pyridinium-3,5-bisthiocarboxylic acid mononucleotide nickel chelatase